MNVTHLRSGLQRGPLGEDELHLLAEVGRRVAADGHVVEVGRVDAASVEAAADGVRGKSGHVLDAAEALFFEGRDEVAVIQKNGRNVTMVGVDAEDVHVHYYRSGNSD